MVCGVLGLWAVVGCEIDIKNKDDKAIKKNNDMEKWEWYLASYTIRFDHDS